MQTVATLIAFEDRIRALWEAGELPFLMHLCGGNEAQLLSIFRAYRPGDWVFSTHRSHYHYLCAGGSPEKLAAMIRAGRSMFVFDASINFLASSVLAGCCAIAAGVASDLRQNSRAPGIRPRCPLDPPSCERVREPWVWCFLGDGAEEEGHFYEAAMFVEGHGLPCTFIIEDNDRSVDTPRRERRGYARGLEDLFSCVRRYTYRPTWPHAGSGAGDPKAFSQAAIADFGLRTAE